MTLLRTIFTIIVLLSQALPVGLLRGEAPPEKCPMSCCAGLAEAGMGDCGCAAAPGVPTTPAPAGLPPAQGRDILPQVVWAEMSDFSVVHSSAHADTGRTLRPEFDTQAATTPHVRLTVLFCSFLT